MYWYIIVVAAIIYVVECNTLPPTMYTKQACQGNIDIYEYILLSAHTRYEYQQLLLLSSGVVLLLFCSRINFCNYKYR